MTMTLAQARFFVACAGVPDGDPVKMQAERIIRRGSQPELFGGADLGFRLVTEIQKPGPTFAQLQGMAAARQENDDRQALIAMEAT